MIAAQIAQRAQRRQVVTAHGDSVTLRTSERKADTMSNTPYDFPSMQRQLGEIIHATVRLVRGELVGDDTENASFKDLLTALERIEKKLRQGTFQVAVLALTKSGKSTLINAFLGDEYLPSAHVPETARIVTIRSASGAAVLEEADTRTEGVNEINVRLRTLNRGARDGDPSATSNLLLKAPFAWVGESELASHPFEILDTPGPNEANASDLHRQVVQVLGDSDAIIYLLDYTKLKTVEEASLLGLLNELRPELLRHCSERLFFVLNKIDTADRNSGTLGETKEYVQRLLAQSFDGLTIQADRIIPVSASHALLSRIITSSTPPEKVLADFVREAFGKRKKSTATLEQCREAAAEFLEDSNVPHLESEVLQFIFRNRGRLLHQSVVDELQRCVTRLANYYTTVQATLKVDHSLNETRLATLQDDLARVAEGLQGILGEGERAKKEVEDWVRVQFRVFTKEAEQVIDDMLGEATPKSRSGFFRVMWASVRELVSGEADNPDEVIQRSNAVNNEIRRFLDIQYAQFQTQLVHEAHERQKAVVARIAKVIAPLARTIEQKVNQTFEISLTPENIELPATSLREFQSEIRRNLARFISSQSRIEEKVEMRTTRVRGNGWCAPTRLVKMPTSSFVSVTQHRISPPALKAFWREQIQTMTDESVTAVSAILDDAFQRIADRARNELETYASGFVRLLERDIKESESHRERRALRLGSVKSRKGASLALMAALHNQASLLVDTSSPQKLTDEPVGPEKARDSFVDLAIVTVLPEEFGAVFALLENCKPAHDPRYVNAHAEHIGEIIAPGHARPYRVVLAMAGVPGNIPTATTVGSVVRRFSPRYVVLSGIAGGLGEKRQRGDIVVARTVTLYEYGKLAESFVPRPEFTHPADTALLNAAEALKAKNLFVSEGLARPTGLGGAVQIDFGPVLSGDKVVDDVNNPLFQEVLRVWPNASAVEMEGAGAAWAIHSLRGEGTSVGFLMIRGISDIPKGNSPGPGDSQSGTIARDEAKNYAANVAAAFVVSLVQHAWPVPPKGSSS
jgi:nucleoside phosphorylase/GTPase Era involved in 16S rRNA processing